MNRQNLHFEADVSLGDFCQGIRIADCRRAGSRGPEAPKGDFGILARTEGASTIHMGNGFIGCTAVAEKAACSTCGTCHCFQILIEYIETIPYRNVG